MSWRDAEGKKRAVALAHDELLTIPQLARESGVGRTKLYGMIERGVLRPVDVDGQKRIPRSEWARYLTRPA